MPRRLLAVAAAAAVLLVFGTGVAAPEGGPAAGGSAYKNDVLGLRIQGPAGWKMATNSKVAPVDWLALVTFYDEPTDTEATLNVRPRRSTTLSQMQSALQKEWNADKTFKVLSIQTVDATTLRPVPSLVVEATQTVTPPAPARPTPRPGEVPPPPAPPPQAVSYYVSAAYWLGPGYEYLLYAKARSTVWSRMRPLVEGIRDSFVLAGGTGGAAGAEGGEGAFQDESRGFSCRYPRGYTVRLPQRKNHVVEFVGVSAEAPVLGIYHFTAEGDVEHDAESLVNYYAQEQSGEATTAPVEFGGKSGTLVTARASVGGKDQTFWIAIARRGENEFFRVRGAAPRAQEAEGKRVFDAFLRSVQIGPAPR